ncbi:arginine/serine-rich coiled-coil protein 2 isoform X2 [Cataglyphis hispanica]|uniref:arginine/serine-rich coiled-coil protein 2 isoform X2 n=1 Tax=Cataglyphis hispanica TaxID=1086592 RepID=UPI00217FB27A|nr:arginine/serine-rich coiled-coil protein 2 isoform X2 [Cataglyphis hispanica]
MPDARGLDRSSSFRTLQVVNMPARGQQEANRRASDANYDPVQMDMSEESNNNNSSRESSSERINSPSAGQSTFGSRTESSRVLSSPSDQRRAVDHENHTSSKDDHRRGDRNDRSRHTSDKSRRYDDRRQRDSNSSHRDRSKDRKNRDDDKRKTSLGSKDEKNDDRERNDKDHHYRGDDRRDRNRDRNERDRRRDRDRERDRRHSRDDRSKDRHRDERSNYHKEKDRTRSRSRSRDRAPPPPFRMMSYREEKGRNKLAQLEKLGIELKPPEGGGDLATGGMQSEQSYYNPLATATQGKYAEQIQKRKLLWANKSKQDDGKSTSTAASTANTWMGTTFTHDQDGKVSAKFKRLMGIKGDLPSAPAVGTKPDILKKQEEMFNNMEQQYEVARATTHTQRGVGLGYASGGYQFSR